MTTGLGWIRIITLAAFLPLAGTAWAVAAGPVPLAVLGFQGGPYFEQAERGLYYPAYLERDSAVITEELGLSDVERVLVEQIIHEYVRQFEEEAREIQARIKTSSGASTGELPNWGERQNVRARASTEMVPTHDATRLVIRPQNSRDRRMRVQAIIREELDLRVDDPLPISVRTSVIRDWSNRRLELQAEVLDKFELIRSIDGEHWDAVNRALRRINTAWSEKFRGEETDLDLLLSEHFGKQSIVYQDLYDDRVEYAKVYDSLLKNRNDVLAATTADLLDARDRTQIEELLSLARQQIDARAALVDVNLAWLGRFIEGIANEDARADFEKYAYLKIFPDLHRGDPPAATIDHLLRVRIVNEDKAKILTELRKQYQAERRIWRAIAIELMPDWERDRLTQEIENNIVALAYKGWLNGFQDTRQSLRDWKKHLDAGVQIDLDYANQIRQIVGETVYTSVPGRYRTARRADPARGPVPGAAGRSANVVYWGEMMESRGRQTVPAP